jgi:GNAT superfamily N-acetyltransferase
MEAIARPYSTRQFGEILKLKMTEIKDSIYFSSNTRDMDLKAIYDFVKDSYWGKGRTLAEQNIALQNSINFGLFHNNKQIAYTRVMTDKVFFAYVLDFFVIEAYRGNGFGKLLMEKVLSFDPLKQVDKWMLATKDAHGLYRKFGFEAVKDPSKLMDRMSHRAKEIYE